MEEIYKQRQYSRMVDLNSVKSNFPALDFADDLVADGKDLISMKTYHPDFPNNRILDNFKRTLESHLKYLDRADLDELAEIARKNIPNAAVDFTGGQKTLTIVVKEGQWDVSKLKDIERNLKQLNPQYQNIIVNIDTF